MIATTYQTHPTDSELLQLLDGEAGPQCGDRWRHVESCSRCTDTLRLLGGMSEAVRDTVATSRPRERPGERAAPRQWLRAAMVAFLLVSTGIGLGVPPVRAWVMRAVGLGPAAVTPNLPAPVQEPPAAPVPESSITFDLSGTELRVTVANRQVGGQLTVVQTDAAGTRVRGWVVGESAGVELIVLASGLLIENTPNAAAAYRIVVPLGVQRVVVRVDQEVTAINSNDIPPEGLVIGLETPR